MLATFDDVDNEDDLDDNLNDDDFDFSALDEEAPDPAPTLPGPQEPAAVGVDRIVALGDPAAIAQPACLPLPDLAPAQPNMGRQISNDIVQIEGLKLKWQASARDFQLLGDDPHMAECLRVGWVQGLMLREGFLV